MIETMPPPIRGKIKVQGLTFCIDNDIELSRAQTLLTKEEGTIRWLNRIKPGDVFYDIGANIGCYTLYAAQRGALVYAFEPHCGNAMKLMKNIKASGLQHRVTVITSALSDKEGFQDFHYRSREAGSAGSHFGEDCPFQEAMSELKHATTISALRGVIPTAQWIKIDVDGNEPLILVGMADVLAGWPPKSIQVEVQPETNVVIVQFMQEHGYNVQERHHTLLGKANLTKGIPESQIAHNVVFERC